MTDARTKPDICDVKTEPEICLDPPADALPRPPLSHAGGFIASAAAEEQAESRVDQIEMIGEELAAGLLTGGRSGVTAGMRYLHSSRTIHQLVTDRNRAVGIYLAVATLMWTASATILNAKPAAPLLEPVMHFGVVFSGVFARPGPPGGGSGTSNMRNRPKNSLPSA